MPEQEEYHYIRTIEAAAREVLAGKCSDEQKKALIESAWKLIEAVEGSE